SFGALLLGGQFLPTQAIVEMPRRCLGRVVLQFAATERLHQFDDGGLLDVLLDGNDSIRLARRRIGLAVIEADDFEVDLANFFRWHAEHTPATALTAETTATTTDAAADSLRSTTTNAGLP